MAYEEPKPGQWVQPVKRGYKLACCDCGLVHTMDFRVHQGRAQFRAWRDPRATGGIRAAMKRRSSLAMCPREDEGMRPAGFYMDNGELTCSI